MAQCFVTTYRNHYRWLDPQVTVSAKPNDNFMNAFPPEEIWIKTEINDDEMDPTILEKLRLCYLKRMITTYKISYCRELVAELLGDNSLKDSNSVESELLRSCKNLYEPESRPKIFSPLPNTRKTFGYIRPSDNYTPLSNYQYNYGETAYRILKSQNQKKTQVLKKPSLEVCCCKKIKSVSG